MHGTVIHWKLSHRRPSPLPASSRTKPLPITLHEDQSCSISFCYWIAAIYTYTLICYILIQACNGISPWTSNSPCHSIAAVNNWQWIRLLGSQLILVCSRRKGWWGEECRGLLQFNLSMTLTLFHCVFSLCWVTSFLWPYQVAQQAEKCLGLVLHPWFLRCLDPLNSFSKRKLSCCLVRQMSRQQKSFQRR